MILLLIGRIFQIVLAVLQIRIATSLLRPDQYGIWILLQSVVAFFVMFLLSPAGLYLNRHINEWDKEKMLPEVFRAYTFFLLVVSAAGIFVFIVIQKINLINLHVKSDLMAALVMALLMLTQTFQQTWISCLNFIGKRKEFILGSLLTTIMSLGIVFIFAQFGWSGPESWAVAFSTGCLTTAFIFIPKEWYKYNHERFLKLRSTINIKDVCYYSLPLFFSTLFIWFQTQGYRFIVESKVGLASLGQFAAGYAVVAGLFAALEVVIVSFYQPNFFKNISFGSEISEELRQVWSISLYPYMLAGAFLVILGPEVAKIFLHSDFIHKTEWISWVVLAEGLRVLFNLICVNYHASKKTFNIAWPHFIGTIITTILFIFTKNLTYLNLIIYLGLGYLVSIILLLGIDYKTFSKSFFFRKFAISAGISLMYFLASSYFSSQLEGIVKIVVVSLIGFIFMVPFYMKNIRRI